MAFEAFLTCEGDFIDDDAVTAPSGQLRQDDDVTVEFEGLEFGPGGSGAPAGSMASRARAGIDDFLTLFPITPMVMIRSKWLKIPKIVLATASFIGIFVYFVVDLHMLNYEEVQANAVVDVQSPASNFWNCSHGDGDCVSVLGAKVPDYCNSTGLCRRFQLADVVPLGQFSAPTASIGLSMVPKRDSNHSANPVWVQGVEEVLIKFRSSFHVGSATESKITSFRADKVQSLLKYHNGSERRLLPYGRSLKESLQVNNKAFFERRFPEVCGGVTGQADTCMGTIWGDYISLSVLLEAAGSPITPDKRNHGFDLDIGIVFTNMDWQDFWSWPVGLKQKIVYTPRFRTYSGEDITYFYRTSSINAQAGEVETMVIRCLQISIYGMGSFGKISVWKFLCELAVLTAVLTTINGLVQHVVARVYGCTGLRHVFYLSQIVSRRFTPACNEYEGAAPWEIEEHIHSPGGLTSGHLWGQRRNSAIDEHQEYSSATEDSNEQPRRAARIPRASSS